MADELVLIVDDDERNSKLARDVLRAQGFETVEARTGEEAVRLALERRPDVILMDLRLPDLDGTEAVRRLRADERSATIPVVALTALTGGSWAADAGFAGWLEKPIDVRAF